MCHKSDTFCMVFHTLAGSRGGGGRGVSGWGGVMSAAITCIAGGGGGRGVLGWGGVISAAPRNHVYRGGGGGGGVGS